MKIRKEYALKIAVLMGGLSPERNVSLTSGALIAAALRRKGHRVLEADIYLGVDTKGKKTDSLFTIEQTTAPTVAEGLPDLLALIAQNGGRTLPVGEGIIEVCRAADCVFLALHGDIGENGQLQALLDLNGIRYTGSGFCGSSLAMDKDIAKKLMRDAGVNTPVSVKFDLNDNLDKVESEVEKIGYPCVVKPCSCGSSVGVSPVENEAELKAAIELAVKYESSVLIEQRIFGREFTQGYVDGSPLPPVEIIPKCGFYDYANKYVANATEEICPANISEAQLRKISEATAKGFKALRLDGYARFDYILDESDTFWCLEANTLPGMTPTSLLPQMANAVGMSYGALCSRIVSLADKK